MNLRISFLTSSYTLTPFQTNLAAHDDDDDAVVLASSEVQLFRCRHHQILRRPLRPSPERR